MTVRSKLLLIVVVSIALTGVSALAVIFLFARQDLINTETASLAAETGRLVEASTLRFAESEARLKSLLRLIENELQKPVQPDESEKFAALVEADNDGIFRSRKVSFNGQLEAGVFSVPSSQAGERQKIDHLRIKQVLDIFGSASTRRFENVYFLAADRSVVIFDRAKPDFVFAMAPEHDFSQLPWVQLGSEATNPERALRFTPPLYDPVWKAWMVSAVLPLYRGSQWLGVLGEDMQLTSVLAFMFNSGTRYPDEQHFLVDTAGNFILAGNWQSLLENDRQAFNLELAGVPQLEKLLGRVVASTTTVLNNDFAMKGRHYLAFGEMIEAVGWRYVRLVPVDSITAPMRRFLWALVMVFGILMVVTGVMIETAATRSISRRITLLADALKGFGKGSYQLSSDVLTGNDEISAAAESFVKMAERQQLMALENKQQFIELNKAETKYRSLVNNSQSIIFALTTNLTVSFVSPAWKRLLGHENDEVTGSDFRRLVHEEDKVEFAVFLQKIQAAEAEKAVTVAESGCEFRVIHKNGSVRWLRSVLTPVLDDQGQIVIYVGNALDITCRKQAEEKLRESEERLRLLMKNSSDSLVVLDAEGRQKFVSPSAEKFTGFSVEELEGLRIQDIIHPDDLPQVQRAWAEALAHPERVVSVQYRHKHKTKEWVHFEAAAQNFLDEPSIRGIVTSVRDITERKKAEKEKEDLHEQLRQAQKMESIGRLAGGIAHDFNNMLGVILGRTELALNRPDQVARPVVEDLKEIRKAAERSARLTRQLQAFARQQTVTPILLDLNETIEGMLKTQRTLIGPGTNLSWLPGANAGRVKMDPAQIDQILSNLCANAAAALGGTGEITIKTDAVYNQTLFPEQSSPADFVLLSVSDNGCGMDETTIANIFEPFFTTRPLGEGTGLGLATVYGIVRQNSGFVKVLSSPQKGTTFDIYLPRQAEGIVLATKEEAKPVQDEKVTILLTEDEPAILNIGTTMLEMLGYRVLAAPAPEAALSLAAEFDGRIHMLLTDVIMPGMNGGELAARLSSLYPDLKCLFMSGYTADVIANHGVIAEGVQFIQKPFTMKELSEKVKSALEAAKPAVAA
ncbi:MAG: PAS domain S-box protein [Candidatus Riflebacteria bacterium]|nr:PAS domain S-box protein [Candidatus Riflebacteria bacterium]